MADELIYFTNTYLDIQRYPELLVYESDHYKICLSVKDHKVHSLPGSPFGGFSCKQKPDQRTFSSFLESLETALHERNISEITVTQPPPYYSFFVPDEWLHQSGFKPLVTDLNQMVDLKNPVFHSMELRKLKQNAHLEILKADAPNLEKYYDFIAKCREHQELKINISKEKFLTLFDTLPSRYDCYAGYCGGELATAVVTAKPTERIVYYYLPATDRKFKSQSPMVKMMEHLYHQYYQEGFEFFDLGISSINGNPQSSLFKFKERMGAGSFERVTFQKDLNGNW